MPRRYTLDQLAQRIHERETHRATGTQDLTLEGIGAAGHWNEISHEQRKNWNLTDDDMVDIENALEDNSIFETKIVKTKETSVAQCNDAVRKMKQGDYSRFNHLPPFLREYYGKKMLEAFFGEEDAIPPLDQNMKRRLNGNLKNPAFRYMITTLITRNAVDSHGNPIAEQLREYDRYMNQKTLALTMDPISEVEKGHLRKKFGEEKANAIMADNLEKQRFMAKTLFMTQLGRVDIHPEEGESEPLKDTVTELFAHGTRVMFTLPSGNSTDQSMLFREWKQRAQDTSVLKEYRFASHDIKRRHVNDNEEKTRDIREIKLKWMDQLTNRDFKNKYFTYLGNYGMNVPLGGLGRSFNGTDCVDDQGSFGHMYIRAKTGEENRCGALLIGIENAAPHSTSCIGQHHGGKAIGHDMSCFFSNRTNVGKIYGGREVDLSHFKPNELSRALRLFDIGYSELQREAATDPAAVADKPVADPASVRNLEEIRRMFSYVDSMRRQWRSMADHTYFSVFNSPEFNTMSKAVNQYLNAYDNIMSGKTADGKEYRADFTRLSNMEYQKLTQLETNMVQAGLAYHDAKLARKQGGFEKHISDQAKDRDAMSLMLGEFSIKARSNDHSERLNGTTEQQKDLQARHKLSEKVAALSRQAERAGLVRRPNRPKPGKQM